MCGLVQVSIMCRALVVTSVGSNDGLDSVFGVWLGQCCWFPYCLDLLFRMMLWFGVALESEWCCECVHYVSGLGWVRCWLDGWMGLVRICVFVSVDVLFPGVFGLPFAHIIVVWFGMR